MHLGRESSCNPVCWWQTRDYSPQTRGILDPRFLITCLYLGLSGFVRVCKLDFFLFEVCVEGEEIRERLHSSFSLFLQISITSVSETGRMRRVLCYLSKLALSIVILCRV